jgi:ornithine carbamoyltransferase
MTIRESKGYLKGLKLAYIGDGNNVANSLLIGCAKTAMNISVATPAGYNCDKKYVLMAQKIASMTGSCIDISSDPESAVSSADVVYTDTWISMGMEADKDKRVRDFAPYQVNSALFSKAKPDAVFLHCLPAYRGFEVTEDVIDGPRSLIFDEAENRLHIQKAVMATLMS